MENRAVCHDLTRERIRHDRGYDGPLITPEEAAEHLIGIANDHDFTLFEFFETDRAGHSGDREKVFQCLEKLDRFFSKVWNFQGLLIVTSDHGNIEDLSVRTHTLNPVPLFASKPELFQSLERIDQVARTILHL
jgi:2,3-bisphosphoglycerate-independent phosphoglycerate mutase